MPQTVFFQPGKVARGDRKRPGKRRLPGLVAISEARVCKNANARKRPRPFGRDAHREARFQRNRLERIPLRFPGTAVNPSKTVCHLKCNVLIFNKWL